MLFSGNLHVFLPPKSFDAFVIHPPTIGDQFSMGARAAKARALPCDPTHLLEKLRFVHSTTQSITLRVAVLAQHPTSSPLGNFFRPQTTSHFRDRASTSFGAHQFPLAASRKISMSRAWFATTFFKRAFSC